MSRNKGLFALENDGLDDGETAGTDVLDAEVGELADVESDTSGDIAGIEEEASAIDDGTTADAQLAQVTEGMQEAVDSGEGLTEVAAEAYRIALTAICKPLGADPKRFFQLYAKESFAAESARMANTSFALEGVKEFVADLYKRIKAALDRMWKKVKAFWDKHISNLGRVKKALDSMKAKIKSNKGKLTGAPFIDSIPSSLARAFNASGELQFSDVNTTLENHKNLFGKVAKSQADAISTLNAVKAEIKTFDKGGKLGPATVKFKEGENEMAPIKDDKLVGGRTVKYVADVTSDDDGIDVEFRVEFETDESDADGSKGMAVPTKDNLLKLLASTEELVKEAITARKNFEKNSDAVNKVLQEVAQTSQKASEKTQKKFRKTMTYLYRGSAAEARISTILISENVRVAKAVLNYAATALKGYK